jgi:hypothetical protein
MRAPGRMVRLATAVLAGALVSVLPRPAVAAAPALGLAENQSGSGH